MLAKNIESPDSSIDTEWHDCSYCGDPYRDGTGDGGSFCSVRCHDDHRREKAAANVLEVIREDHRFCSTCFRLIAEVEKPPEKWGIPSCVIGYQYGTKHARTVWQESNGRKKTGIGCQCGNCQHYHGDETLRRRRLITATHYLNCAADLLRIEGKIDTAVDRERLFDAVIDVGAIRPALEVALIRNE